jgi:hypothetical protein
MLKAVYARERPLMALACKSGAFLNYNYLGGGESGDMEAD